MKEKKFLRWLLTGTALILGIYITVSQLMGLFMNHVFEDRLLNLTNAYIYETDETFDAGRYEITVDYPALVTVRGLEQRDGGIYLIAEPAARAEGQAYIEIYDKEADWAVDSALLRVYKSGLIVDRLTANFTHYRERQLCILAVVIALTLLLWIGYFKSLRELRFSYHSIFCIGLGIWGAVISAVMLVHYLRQDVMINYYSALSGAAGWFVLVTFPFILLFATALSVSNVSLIRHEGFRFSNALGILLSTAMLGGVVFLFFFSDVISSGYELYVKLWSAFSGTFTVAYALLECFLLGAIICGTRAAKRQPAYDRDYIVILGCMIRPDGSLYPLLRGRVDRAIRFYREQLEATGKKAIFVPSGGKGPDEPIPEAAAMKRYLLEQGIPEEQIMPEEQSVNTRQNMEFSKKLIGGDAKAAFSTTNFHVFRSGIIAGQADFAIEGMGSPTKWYFWPNAYIREVIGMLSYKWKALVILFVPVAAFLATVRLAF